ncbi:uncharacterized protein TNCV_3352101 [Trichonephila clavipes]|nr:uncharacterized protein TNCV_3352101 [Trichonephila clavipes]
MVKVMNSWLVCHKFESSTTEDPAEDWHRGRDMGFSHNPESKRQSMAWSHTNSPVRVKAKRTISTRKSHYVLHPVEWLAQLCLGSNPVEDMAVCKRIVPSRHGGTLNSRRAASPVVSLVEGKERWDPLTTPRVFTLKIGMKPS